MMAQGAGWKQLKEYIESNLKAVEEDLNNNFDLTKEQFNILQARRQELVKVIDFVERRVREVGSADT